MILPRLEDRVIFLFDVDGVIAETPHEEAWKAAAVEWGIIPEDFSFTLFYAKHVAGEPGITGARNILGLLREGAKPTYYEREGITDTHKRDESAEQFRNPAKQKYLDGYIADGNFRVFDDISKIILGAKNAGIPVAAVSSSENSEAILKSINAIELAKRVKVPYTPARKDASLYDVFNTTVLGAITHWHGAKVEKINHYAMAYGKLLGKIDRKEIPYAVVFEDAPKGVAAVSQLGFYCIGISRNSTSGVTLASKEDLFRTGAKLAYAENELKHIGYKQLRPAIIGIIPMEVK